MNGKVNTILTVAVLAVLAAGCNEAMNTSMATDPGIPVAVAPVIEVKPEAARRVPRIQVALLLDTSGSMNGLIRQAQSQLWKLVNEFATMERDGLRPQVEVALYQYGSGRLPGEDGYMRQILPLSRDLDKASEALFALTSSGSKEYCGQVIERAVTELIWSENSNDLKTIFIAGNEEFTQGSVDYRVACKAAIAKGIAVNTIYCGNIDEGARTGWQDGAKIADGTYASIDKDRAVVHVAAPQDKEIASLSTKLNDTYVPYGKKGAEGSKRQAEQESNSAKAGEASVVQRAVSKSSGQYDNTSWDLVDAVKNDAVKVEEVPEEALPEPMQKMSVTERKEYVEDQAQRRGDIQTRINDLNDARKKHVAAKEKELAAKGEATLDQAVVEAARVQAARQGFKTE
jgi:von Willebrand factor type A domain